MAPYKISWGQVYLIIYQCIHIFHVEKGKNKTNLFLNDYINNIVHIKSTNIKYQILQFSFFLYPP